MKICVAFVLFSLVSVLMTPLVAAEDRNCPDYCAGGIQYSRGTYDVRTGTCGYSSVISCSYGCDVRDSGCAGAPAATMTTVATAERSCPDYCSDRVAYSRGTWNSRAGTCDYAYRSACDSGCDPWGTTCAAALATTTTPEVRLSCPDTCSGGVHSFNGDYSTIMQQCTYMTRTCVNGCAGTTCARDPAGCADYCRDGVRYTNGTWEMWAQQCIYQFREECTSGCDARGTGCTPVVTTPAPSETRAFVTCPDSCSCISRQAAAERWKDGARMCDNNPCGKTADGTDMFCIQPSGSSAADRALSVSEQHIPCPDGCSCISREGAAERWRSAVRMCSASPCGSDKDGTKLYCIRPTEEKTAGIRQQFTGSSGTVVTVNPVFEGDHLVFVVSRDRQAVLLGVIPVRMTVNTRLNATDLSPERDERPWWGFLTTEPAPPAPAPPPATPTPAPLPAAGAGACGDPAWNKKCYDSAYDLDGDCHMTKDAAVSVCGYTLKNTFGQSEYQEWVATYPWDCNDADPAVWVCEKTPTIDAWLVYWGDNLTDQQIQERSAYIVQYFDQKTGGTVLLNITYGGSFPVHGEDAEHDYSTVAAQYGIPAETAKYVWYYYHKDVMEKETTGVIQQSGFSPAQYDLAIVLSDVAFASNGKIYKYYPYIFLPGTGYGGWELGKLSVTSHSNEFLSDVLTHELGHYMGLNHACVVVPCTECAYPHDLMSLCRERGAAKNGFFTCSMTNIGKYAQANPDGSLYSIIQTWGLCDEVSAASKCAGVSCGNYCDTTTLYLGGSCNFISGQCMYKMQPDSASCKGGCTKILSRTNIANGIYSGDGIDDNTGWIAVDLYPESGTLTGYGWYGKYNAEIIPENLQLVGFTWDGLPIEADKSGYKMIVIDRTGQGYLYTQDSMNAKNALLSKTAVGGYAKYEFIGDCTGMKDLCAGVACEENCKGTTLLKNGACDPLSGKCAYTDVTPESPQCGFVPKCAGVVCPDKCAGTTLNWNGSCSEVSGTCLYYNITLNSPACGFTTPCTGVVCPDKCVSTTLLSEGKCYEPKGECLYDKATPDSPVCTT